MPASIPPHVTSRDDVTILCASELRPAANQRAARVVVYRNPLKLSREEYVVHTELLEPLEPGAFRHFSFSDGSYVPDLRTALERFDERCGKL